MVAGSKVRQRLRRALDSMKESDLDKSARLRVLATTALTSLAC